MEHGEEISTNLIASKIKTKASSVTDMLKKLSAKDLVVYKKYQGVRLTERGRETALRVVRKHRLWECFLVQKLDFKWDEVHEIAEQLARQFGVRAAPSTVWHFFNKRGITFKKRQHMRPSKNAKTF